MSALKKGITIKIKGLKDNNWRNGRIGIIQGKYTDKKDFERWKVKIIGEDGKSENYLGLKPENIEIIHVGKVWEWLELDESSEGERPETPPSAPQSPKNTNTKGGRTRKKIRKRKKRKSRRKKRKQKKKKKSFRRK